MSKIAFLMPHKPMLPIIKNVLNDYSAQIYVEYCQLNNYAEKAAKLLDQGCEIIVSRSGLADRLKATGLAIAVVELPVTGFDIIRAVQTAQTHGKNIAVIAYPSMARGIECLTPSMGFSFALYWVNHYDLQIEDLVLQAIRSGADVVVGGGIICQTASKHGLPSVFIESGKESILLAAEEAFRLAHAVEAEKIKHSLFSAILDYVHDGIITVDCEQKITSINMRAQQVFNISATKTIGQFITSLWPGLDLSQIIKIRREETNKLLAIKDLKVICNKVPIVVNNKLSGALVTFQDITKIQQAEAQIRKKIYNKGHIARKNFEDVWGTSSIMTRTISLAKEFASTNSNILIIGETGTGKEVFAQSIHNQSSRHLGPFVAVNCAALPAQILESELFGYVGGAFTGANKEGKPGLFELAHGGTIFLDEIAEMDYVNQSRLLRVLQERSVMRLGSDRVIAVDTRVIAASNKNLKELVKTNKFREDLYFRLNVLKLQLPTLRERRHDIKIMAENFLNKYTLTTQKHMKLSVAALKILENYNWPGNIRELQNTIERLVAFCQNKIIRPADIEAVIEDWEAESANSPFHKEEIKKIINALTQAQGVQTQAAKILGIDRKTLWRKMRKYSIKI